MKNHDDLLEKLLTEISEQELIQMLARGIVQGKLGPMLIVNLVEALRAARKAEALATVGARVAHEQRGWEHRRTHRPDCHCESCNAHGEDGMDRIVKDCR